MSGGALEAHPDLHPPRRDQGPPTGPRTAETKKHPDAQDVARASLCAWGIERVVYPAPKQDGRSPLSQA